jgi:hypothetical protein
MRMVRGLSERAAVRRRLVRRSDLGILLVLVWGAGCGLDDSGGRRAISGVVTFDGQPLDNGVIRLEPRSASEAGMAVGATIRRGVFALARQDGPTPGTYRVRIYSSSGVQAPPAEGQSENTRRPMVERLPAAYNEGSELQVDVTADGPNHFRFDLRGRADG